MLDTVLLLTSLAATCAEPAERLQFAVVPGTRLAKSLRLGHELQVERIGSTREDGPFVSDGTGGWLSANEKLEFVDEYVAVDALRPLELVRYHLRADFDAKATLSRGGQKLDERSHSTSQLAGKSVAFTWIDAESDWSRCFARVEGDEEVLLGLRGELDLLGLLPGREVAPGDQWEIAPARLRDCLAPGGDLSMFPTDGSLFGRTIELGMGGDFADLLAPDFDGTVSATYRGVREITLASATEGEPPSTLQVGVVELDILIASQADRTALYRSATPEAERRETSRLDSVPLEYNFSGKGELLWNLGGGHFHSLTITGKERFDMHIKKTQFVGARESFPYSQVATYSGDLSFELSASDGSKIDVEGPTSATKGGKKKQR